MSSKIRNHENQAEILSVLARLDKTYFPMVLESLNLMSSHDNKAKILTFIAKYDASYFNIALEEARHIKDESSRADILIELAEIDPICLSEGFESVYSSELLSFRIQQMVKICKINSDYCLPALEMCLHIGDSEIYAECLSNLALNFNDSLYYSIASDLIGQMENSFLRERFF